MDNYRDTYAKVNLLALKRNVEYIYSKAKKPIMAIVKANAYGHGACEVALYIENMPCIAMFGVATLKEGIELRNKGIKKDILVLGATRKEDLNLASQYDITISIFSMEFLSEIIDVDLKSLLKAHIKLDTGMNRIGLKGCDELNRALLKLKDKKNIEIEGVFTHYGAADELNQTYDQQFNRFKEAVGNRQFKYIHAANTAGALYHVEDFTNLVRAGIAIYGMEPNGSDDTTLEQVMSLYTKVVMVKPLKKGEMVGYGFTYRARQDEWLATVPIGYADGIIRKNQNRHVCINGRYYQIVGRVCMDQMMIRVDSNVRVGDEVEIFGPHITLNQMSKELDTIPHEILCLLSSRVSRLYYEDKVSI